MKTELGFPDTAGLATDPEWEFVVEGETVELACDATGPRCECDWRYVSHEAKMNLARTEYSERRGKTMVTYILRSGSA